MQFAPRCADRAENGGRGLPAGGFGWANTPVPRTSRYVAVLGGLGNFPPVLFVG